MYLQRPNLYLEASEMIKLMFERTTQDRSRVFSNVPIRRILDESTQLFAYRNVKYAKYTVGREDGRMYTFTEADLINLYAYDLPHLHDYLCRRMENIKDYVAYLRGVVQLMRKHILLNSQIDFEIGLQLGEENIALK